MHAVLLTLFLVTGAEQPAPQADLQPYAAPVVGGCEACGGQQQEGCGTCRGGGCIKGAFNRVWDWWGPMPQTCYEPRFGCYSGNSRYMNRYPAFHGYYYRQPYNYRQYFDYPWHAQPYEPMGYFTYQKSAPADPQSAPPVEMESPMPVPAAPSAVPAPPSMSQHGWKPMSASRTARN